MQWFCSIDWFVPTKKVDVQTTFHFCSDQTYISRATTYIPSEQFKQLLLNLRHWAYKVFRLFPLLTPNDLWPPWKTIGIICSLRGTYILILKFKQLSLLETISCLQGFETLITVDLKWPLTSMKNNRGHLLTKGYLHTKFEVHATFTSWDIVFTSRGITYTHTHTHTHTPLPSHRFLWPSARNQKCLS